MTLLPNKGGLALIAMRSRPLLVVSLVSLIASLSATVHAAAAANASQLSAAAVRDKIAGGWLGEVIGGAWGRPTEFRFRGRIVPADRFPPWDVGRANRYTYRGDSDETYVEIPFLDATRR